MTLRHLLTATLIATGIGAHNGADAGAPAAPLPVVSTDTFQVKTAYINYFNDISSHPFTISGATAGLVVTGSGTVTHSPVTSGIFEGASALQKTTTITGSFVANGVTIVLTVADTAFVDANYVAKGWTGQGYVVVTSGATMPDTAKIHDTGLWHTSNRYADSSKTTLLGTSEVRFTLAPDTATTALLRITQVDKDRFGDRLMAATANFRVTPAGDLTRLSETAIEGSTTMTLTY